MHSHKGLVFTHNTRMEWLLHSHKMLSHVHKSFLHNLSITRSGQAFAHVLTCTQSSQNSHKMLSHSPKTFAFTQSTLTNAFRFELNTHILGKTHRLSLSRRRRKRSPLHKTVSRFRESAFTFARALTFVQNNRFHVKCS